MLCTLTYTYYINQYHYVYAVWVLIEYAPSFYIMLYCSTLTSTIFYVTKLNDTWIYDSIYLYLTLRYYSKHTHTHLHGSFMFILYLTGRIVQESWNNLKLILSLPFRRGNLFRHGVSMSVRLRPSTNSNSVDGTVATFRSPSRWFLDEMGFLGLGRSGEHLHWMNLHPRVGCCFFFFSCPWKHPRNILARTALFASTVFQDFAANASCSERNKWAGTLSSVLWPEVLCTRSTWECGSWCLSWVCGQNSKPRAPNILEIFSITPSQFWVLVAWIILTIPLMPWPGFYCQWPEIYTATTFMQQPSIMPSGSSGRPWVKHCIPFSKTTGGRDVGNA